MNPMRDNHQDKSWHAGEENREKDDRDHRLATGKSQDFYELGRRVYVIT